MKKVYFYMVESCKEYKYPKDFIMSIMVDNNDNYISTMAKTAFEKYCSLKNLSNHILIDYTYLGSELPFYDFSFEKEN